MGVWVERSASVDVEAGADELFIYYSDLENLPVWSPWVKDVSLFDDDPLGSEWTLGVNGFTFKWQSRITELERGQRIAWRSDGGLNNEGMVTFTPGATTSSNPKQTHPNTTVKLMIRFNIPRVVAVLFSAAFVGRFVDMTLSQDLHRFKEMSMRKVEQRVAMGKPPPTRLTAPVDRAIRALRDIRKAVPRNLAICPAVPPPNHAAKQNSK